MQSCVHGSSGKYMGQSLLTQEIYGLSVNTKSNRADNFAGMSFTSRLL